MTRARLGRSYSSADDPGGEKQSKWDRERDRLDSGISSNSGSSESISSLPDLLSDISVGSPTSPGLEIEIPHHY